LQQSAPTAQTANAQATSTQSGAINLGTGGPANQTNISSATALADNSNQTTQAAEQIQHGGVGGSQVQVIEQDAPITQIGNASATSDQSGATNASGQGPSSQTNTSSSTAGAGKSNQTAQSAHQTQEGGGSQVQVVHQSAPSAQSSDAIATGKKNRKATRHAGWESARLDLALQRQGAQWFHPSASKSAAAPRSARRSDSRAPRDPRAPMPHDPPPTLGAAAGASTGGSLWIFAALLIPFALTAPWWASRQRPSGLLRRLMDVLLRLERPG